MPRKLSLILCGAMLLQSALCQPKIASQTPPTAAITEHTATTSSGISIHYLQSGQPKAERALILIPGWRLPAYLWNRQLREFSGLMRVIAIDSRSQGASTKTHEGNSPEMRARDLHDVLAVLGVSHPVLVGWSQGAQDVGAYVQEYGNSSVDGVVLVDSPVWRGAAEVKEHPEFAQGVLSRMPVYVSDPQTFSQGMVRSLFNKPHPELDLDRIVKDTLRTPADTGVAMLIADIFGADRRGGLAKLDKPALVIASSASDVLDVQKQMAASIPGAKFLAIDDAAHAVFIDQPERFDAALREFIASLNP